MIREPKEIEIVKNKGGFIDSGTTDRPVDRDVNDNSVLGPNMSQTQSEETNTPETIRKAPDTVLSEVFNKVPEIDINVDIDYEPATYNVVTGEGIFKVFSSVTIENRYNYLSKYEILLANKIKNGTIVEEQLPNYYALRMLAGDKKLDVPGQFYNFFRMPNWRWEQINNSKKFLFNAKNCAFFAGLTEDIYDIPFYKYIKIKTRKSSGMVKFLGQLGYLDKAIATTENPPIVQNTQSIPEDITQIRLDNLEDKITNKNKIQEKILLKKLDEYKQNTSDGYKEVAYYIIEKHFFNLKLQEYYIPNVYELDTINFYDTQVFYNKSYGYKVYEVSLVKVDGNFITEKTKIFDNTSIPTAIISKPPMPPNVDIFSYGNSEDAIKIILSTTSGHSYLTPVVTGKVTDNLDLEMKKVSDIRSTQQIPDGPLEYSNDDYLSTCHMLYSDEMPTGWESFKRIKLKNNKFSLDNRKEIEFFLEPNKEHYICFQVVDYHGNISNPTNIYKIFIDRDDDGKVQHFYDYHEHNYYFEKKIKTNKNKNCRRFLYIAPNEEQTYYDRFKRDMGGAQYSVWSKPWKARLTSKHTGRKIDIHFAFDKTKREK